MSGLKLLLPAEISTIQKALGIILPHDYVRFMVSHRMPNPYYLGAEELIELAGFEASILITFNENLRDINLQPEGWNEQHFAIGEAAYGGGIFYLDLTQKSPDSSVYIREDGHVDGQLVSGNFTRWAVAMLDQLMQEDERIRQWHVNQQPRWWRWVMGRVR